MFRAGELTRFHAENPIHNKVCAVLETVQQPRVIVAIAVVASSVFMLYANSSTLISLGSWSIVYLIPSVIALFSIALKITLLVGAGILATAALVSASYGATRLLRNPIELESCITQESASISKTSDRDGAVNLAYAYVDSKNNFGFVADGIRSDKPELKPLQDKLFGQFNKKLAHALATTKFFSLKDVERCLRVQLRILSAHIGSVRLDSKYFDSYSKGVYYPAISFAQIVKVQDKIWLLTAQLGDCMLLLRHPSGKFEPISTPKKDNDIWRGLGNYQDGELAKPSVCFREITSKCEVFGFSKNLKEVGYQYFQHEIKSNKSRSKLMKEIKESPDISYPFSKNLDAIALFSFKVK